MAPPGVTLKTPVKLGATVRAVTLPTTLCPKLSLATTSITSSPTTPNGGVKSPFVASEQFSGAATDERDDRLVHVTAPVSPEPAGKEVERSSVAPARCV